MHWHLAFINKSIHILFLPHFLSVCLRVRDTVSVRRTTSMGISDPKQEQAEKKDADDGKGAQPVQDGVKLTDKICQLLVKADEFVRRSLYGDAKAVIFQAIAVINLREHGTGKITDYAYSYYRLAVCEHWMGNLESAAFASDMAMASGVIDAEDRIMGHIWYFKGMYSHAKGRYPEAFVFLSSAIRRLKDNIYYLHLYWTKAGLGIKLGMYREAVDDYRLAKARYLELGMEADAKDCDVEIDKWSGVIDPVPV